jgi:hypothetical protein
MMHQPIWRRSQITDSKKKHPSSPKYSCFLEKRTEASDNYVIAFQDETSIVPTLLNTTTRENGRNISDTLRKTCNKILTTRKNLKLSCKFMGLRGYRNLENSVWGTASSAEIHSAASQRVPRVM